TMGLFYVVGRCRSSSVVPASLMKELRGVIEELRGEASGLRRERYEYKRITIVPPPKAARTPNQLGRRPRPTPGQSRGRPTQLRRGPLPRTLAGSAVDNLAIQVYLRN